MTCPKPYNEADDKQAMSPWMAGVSQHSCQPGLLGLQQRLPVAAARDSPVALQRCCAKATSCHQCHTSLPPSKCRELCSCSNAWPAAKASIGSSRSGRPQMVDGDLDALR